VPNLRALKVVRGEDSAGRADPGERSIALEEVTELENGSSTESSLRNSNFLDTLHAQDSQTICSSSQAPDPEK
jgi:hypothetical protein